MSAAVVPALHTVIEAVRSEVPSMTVTLGLCEQAASVQSLAT